MPALSKSQQQLFGIAYALKKRKISPEKVSEPAKKIAKTMSNKEIKKFAKTKTKNLPKKVKREENIKMKKSELKQIIKEEINKNELKSLIKEEVKSLITEIQTEEELEKEIEIYKETEQKIAELQAQIQDVIDEIARKNAENKKRFSEVEKFMIRFNISSKKVGKWIAKVETVLKYKVVRPDYKELWLTLMQKVNRAIQNVMNRLLESQLEIKKKETVQQLVIEEGIFDAIKNLFNKFKEWIKSVIEFSKLADKLPNIKQ